MSGILNGIKLLLTTVRIDDDSGVLVQEGVLASKVKWIRIWNFVEPCAVYGPILLIIWTSMLDMKIWWVRPSLGVILAWLLVISPAIHYPFEKDVFLSERRRHRWGPFWFWFFECRGLGSPFKYYLPLDGERPYIIKYWKTILGVTLFIDLLFVSACITFSEEIAERIEVEADAAKADLIVMGTHGRRGVRRLMLGSVAEGLLRVSNRPVLLVRDK